MDIGHRLLRDAVEANDDQIGMLSLFQRADLFIQTERCGTADRCGTKHILGGNESPSVSAISGGERRKTSFLEHVARVIARNRVGAEADRNVLIQISLERGKPVRKFCVRFWTMSDRRAALANYIDVAVGHVDAVSEQRARFENP